MCNFRVWSNCHLQWYRQRWWTAWFLAEIIWVAIFFEAICISVSFFVFLNLVEANKMYHSIHCFSYESKCLCKIWCEHLSCKRSLSSQKCLTVQEKCSEIWITSRRSSNLTREIASHPLIRKRFRDVFCIRLRWSLIFLFISSTFLSTFLKCLFNFFFIFLNRVFIFSNRFFTSSNHSFILFFTSLNRSSILIFTFLIWDAINSRWLRNFWLIRSLCMSDVRLNIIRLWSTYSSDAFSSDDEIRAIACVSLRITTRERVKLYVISETITFGSL